MKADDGSFVLRSGSGLLLELNRAAVSSGNIREDFH